MSGSAIDACNTFGELLEYLRQRSRLTQEELGLAVGYSRARRATGARKGASVR